MKIGIDIRPLQEAQPSGVSEYTRELLRALFAIDRENEYHLFSNSVQRSAFSVQSHPNVTLHQFHYPNKFLNACFRFFNAPKIDSLIQKSGQRSAVSGRLDLFFMPNLNFVALSPHIPLVVTAHDLSFALSPTFFSKKQQLWHRFTSPRKLFERAHRIIAVSTHTKNDLTRHYGLATEKITVTHLGLSPIFFEYVPADETRVRKTYRLPGNFILFLATVEPRKNVEAALEAFRLLKKDYRFDDLHLVIAGKNKLFSYSRELENKDVHFFGYVPTEDRPALYRLARAFVYPSYYEGFGLPPLEAMSQGTPVIASHTSSLGEVLGNAALLVDPHNIADVHAALREVLTDQTLANELSRRGREHVKKFSWEQAARDTLAVFEEVINTIATRH